MAVQDEDSTHRKMYVDDTSHEKCVGTSVILFTPNGLVIKHSFRHGFSASNNEAKNEALILGLAVAKQRGIRHLWIFNHSQLVIKKINREYEAWDSKMIKYLEVTQDHMHQLLVFF